jgi:hypothetical protein
MRLILEITKTRSGRYEGHITLPGTTGQWDFAGILELLAILEQLVHPHEGEGSAGRGSGAGRDGISEWDAPA